MGGSRDAVGGAAGLDRHSPGVENTENRNTFRFNFEGNDHSLFKAYGTNAGSNIVTGMPAIRSQSDCVAGLDDALHVFNGIAWIEA